MLVVSSGPRPGVLHVAAAQARSVLHGTGPGTSRVAVLGRDAHVTVLDDVFPSTDAALQIAAALQVVHHHEDFLVLTHDLDTGTHRLRIWDPRGPGRPLCDEVLDRA